MATEVKAPKNYDSSVKFTIFLAGSIEMDKADPWQKEAVELLSDYKVLILNPRRDAWDSSWQQTIIDKNFNEQVNWELDGLEKSDAILLYFDPKTKSPVSMLELGLFAAKHKLHVVCPDGFWRKGNVDIVCVRAKIPQYKTIQEAIDAIISTYSLFKEKK